MLCPQRNPKRVSVQKQSTNRTIMKLVVKSRRVLYIFGIVTRDTEEMTRCAVLPNEILDEAVDGEERRVVEADVRADARQGRGGLRGAAARHSHVRRGRHGRGRDPKAAPPYLRAARGRASTRARRFRRARAASTNSARLNTGNDSDYGSFLRGRTNYCYNCQGFATLDIFQQIKTTYNFLRTLPRF